MNTGEMPQRPELCWRVIEGPTTRILTCAIFAISSAELEVRVSYEADTTLHAEIVADIESARALAQAWLVGVRTNGASSEGRRKKSTSGFAATDRPEAPGDGTDARRPAGGGAR